MRFEMLSRKTKLAFLLVFANLLGACGEAVYDEIDLMPSPTVYSDARLDPFANIHAQVTSPVAWAVQCCKAVG